MTEVLLLLASTAAGFGLCRFRSLKSEVLLLDKNLGNLKNKTAHDLFYIFFLEIVKELRVINSIVFTMCCLQGCCLGLLWGFSLPVQTIWLFCKMHHQSDKDAILPL